MVTRLPGRSARLERIGRPLLLFLGVFALGQLYFGSASSLPAEFGRWIGLAVPLGAIGLFLAWVRWEGRPLSSYGFARPYRPAFTVGVATLLVAVYIVAMLEPGFGLGFAARPIPSLESLGFWLVYAPITALAGEAVFRGYLLDRWLVPGRFASALGVSSALFAITAMNLSGLVALDPITLVRLLLVNAGGLFVLGVVLGFYFFRSRRNLVGPVVLRTGVLLFSALSPVVARTSGWTGTLLTVLLASGLVLFLITWLIRPSRFAARTYLGEEWGPRRGRLRERVGQRRHLRATVVVVVLVVMLVIGGFLALEAVLGTSRPILAIASGSMAPEFERGDIVVLAHADVASITVGTVIAYSSTCLPSPVVHRVTSVQESGPGTTYTTKGDANPAPDPCPVPYGSVLGLVLFGVPVLGYFVLSPALAIGAVALVVVALYLFRPDARTVSVSRRYRT